MARINELMSQGMAAPVARMLGVNSIASVPAGGTSQATATPLPINFAVLTSQSATAGVLLPTALGGGISVYYNSGPQPLLIYPYANEAFQDANVNLPLTLQVHGTAVLIPSGNCWLAALTAPPGFTAPPVPGGSGGQIQVNSGGSFVGMPAVSGDGLLNTGTGIFTLTGLAGHSLLATQPNQGDVLTWSAASNAWGPSPGVPGPVGPVGPVGPAGPTGAAGSVIVSDTAPTTTINGQLWWNSNDGQLYLWFVDQNSSQYVIANSTPGGLGTTIADAPNDGFFYGRSALTWQRVLGLNGGTLTGPVLAAADPTVAAGLATKNYVDTHSGGTISGVTAGTGLTGGGTSGTVTVSLLSPVLVTNGGTGLATLPSGALLQGNGTGPVTAVTLPLGVAQGGTGQTGMTPGQLIRGAGTSTAPFVASTINDTGLGVTIGKTVGTPIPGAPGIAGSLILAGPLVVNNNAAALPAPATGTLLQVGNTDATTTGITIDAFGVGGPQLFGRHAMGTNAAKTALGPANALLALAGQGYDGTAYSSTQAQINFQALNAWSTTDHSTDIVFWTTPPGSTTQAIVATFRNDLGCQLLGTTTNDNAPAGYVGETITSQVGYGSRITLPTSGVAANLTSISLTPGDWDIVANLCFVPSVSATYAQAGISTTSAGLPDASVNAITIPGSGTGEFLTVQPMQTRLSIATTTTVYLVASANWSSGSMQMCGIIVARRRR